MFKIGDKVVYIGDGIVKTLIENDKIDTSVDIKGKIVLYSTYTILETIDSFTGIYHKLEELTEKWYSERVFISQEEYQKSKRKDKLNILKEKINGQ